MSTKGRKAKGQTGRGGRRESGKALPITQGNTPAKVILCIAATLAALSAVAWRQSTALETMEELESVKRELALAADEREELTRRLMLMEGRPWVGEQAAERLGMRSPSEREVMILPGADR